MKRIQITENGITFTRLVPDDTDATERPVTVATAPPTPTKKCGACGKKANKEPKQLEIITTSPFILPGVIDPIMTPWRDEKGWQKDKQEVDKHFTALRQIASTAHEFPGGEGDGVVVCGGGNYSVMSLGMINALRELGYDGPIEWWYRSSVESIEDQDRKIGSSLGATILDMDAATRRLTKGVTQRSAGRFSKWHAIANSSFRRVLFMDSDMIPYVHPSRILSLVKEHGFVYWTKNSNHVTWQDWGLPGKPDWYTAQAVHGGVYGIDREACWQTVVSALWATNHADFFIQQFGGAMYGEEDISTMCLSLTKGKGHVIGTARHVSGYGVKMEFEGAPAFDHHYGTKPNSIPTRLEADKAAITVHLSKLNNVLAKINDESNYTHPNVVGWFGKDEGRFWAESVKGKRVLETGRAKGRSTCIALLNGAAHVTSVDSDRMFKNGTEEAVDNLKKYGVYDKCTVLKGTTAEVLPTLAGTFDAILFDADHSREGLTLDIELCQRFMKPGTRLGFHDYVGTKHTPDVKPTVDEHASLYGWKLIGIVEKLIIFEVIQPTVTTTV